MKRSIVLSIVLLALLPVMRLSAQDIINLAGPWDIATGDTTSLGGYVILPGRLQTVQGNDAEELRYQRTIYIPKDWRRRHIVLFLEQPHTETSVFVNGQLAGRRQALNVPHEYDVTPLLKPGESNTIAISLRRGTAYGQNGFAGRLELQAHPTSLYVKQARVTPYPLNHLLHVEVKFDGDSNPLYVHDMLSVVITPDQQADSLLLFRNFELTGRRMSLNIPWENFRVWDEFSPQCYRLGLSVGDDYYETVFGMREVRAEDGWPYLNGLQLWLRGTQDDSCFLTDTEGAWADLFCQYKSFGLNYVRFQDGCPPDEAFLAADRLGLYLQVDGGDETQRIDEVYGHHPSLITVPNSLLERLCPSGSDLSVQTFKQAIEKNLCDTTYAGFLMTGFNDYLRRTGNRDVALWQEFCGAFVPVACLSQATSVSTDSLMIPVKVYNALNGHVTRVRKSYFVTDGNQVMAGGSLSGDMIPRGKGNQVGTIVLPSDTTVRRLTLTVQIGKDCRNHWEIIQEQGAE